MHGVVVAFVCLPQGGQKAFIGRKSGLLRKEGVIDRASDSPKGNIYIVPPYHVIIVTLCSCICQQPFSHLIHWTLAFGSIASDLATPEFQGPRLVLLCKA